MCKVTCVTRKILIGLALFACAAGPAAAQAFPVRPITVYVPFVAGTTDTMARKVAEVAARSLGQQW